MSGRRPSPAEQAQWLQLRALHERRAQRALREAEQALADARHAVARREALIAQQHAALHALAARWAPAAADMPRWASLSERHRAWLDEWRERHAYALLDEAHALAQAEDAWRDGRERLARACARHEAVAQQTRQLRAQAGRERERRAMADPS